jgi:hypothetical protein
MISFPKMAAELWRAFVTDGVASSGAHKPLKADMRAWGLKVEAALATTALYLTSVAGTANAITATTSPATSAYSTGQVLFLVPASANTGAVTLNVNGLGAVAVTRATGAALAGGELVAGRLYELVYDGTGFRLTSTPYLEGSATYDPPSLADGAGVTTTVTVTGAALGDYVPAVSFSQNLNGITVTAWVSAANTVSVRFQNESGGTLDLASGTLRVRVEKA